MDRSVNATGLISLAGQQHPVGIQFAGQASLDPDCRAVKNFEIFDPETLGLSPNWLKLAASSLALPPKDH